ncbi:hypothetical protein Prum_020940 [Phytohabitans rumicis]|uniref:Dynamin family protein n=2 Tax=Phytohabitans rumicis TaxID=1076125 RepID=A0A6V8KTK6_9ACTN|nr:hypothetical protein Prum_020940 [Phytohabitans rumicis]
MKIAATIAGRARHRPAVERVRVAYEDLAGRFDDVRRLAKDARQEAYRHSARPEFAAIGQDLADFLEGPRSLDTLTERINELRSQVMAVHARVHRETVNIGVLGRTKAGKSTILRKVANQGEDVIPSGSDFPTTAARTRIYHSPDRREAVITLRTWEAFRDEYVQPLHTSAGLGAAPRTPDEFAAYSYPASVTIDSGTRGAGAPPERLSAQPFLVKLNQAQRSFPSYRQILLGQERVMTVPLASLRPYIAYPLDQNGVDRPYHAVRDVHIYCRFLVDRARLVLVDLPGAGEAGLEIDRHFLRDINNDVDLLLCIKKPIKDTVHHGTDDFEILQLAQDAGRDVRLADFLMMVVNRDADLGEGSFRNALTAVEAVTRPHGIEVLVCDATDEASVRDRLLLPVLDRLADRLADMDAMAIERMRGGLADLADEVGDLLSRVNRSAAEWRRVLPEDEDELYRQAAKLRRSLSLALRELYKAYEESVRGGTPIDEIEAAIDDAERRVREWAAQGYGVGGHSEWEAETVAAMATEPFREYERQLNGARHEITRQFQHIDASLHAAVDRLWGEVAAVLRERLTPDLVPDGPDALPRLLEAIGHLNVPAFRRAVERLAQLKKDYGSLFLRVATPIVIKVDLESWQARLMVHRAGAAPAPTATPSGRTGSDDEWWLDYEESAQPRTPGDAPVSPAPRPGAGWTEPAGLGTPADHTKNLAALLNSAIDEALGELTESLRRESLSITSVLAATLWVFWDGAGRTPDGELEYKKICGPYRTTIWPEVFDGSAAQLSGRMGALDEGVGSLAGSAATLQQALTGPAGA